MRGAWRMTGAVLNPHADDLICSKTMIDKALVLNGAQEILNRTEFEVLQLPQNLVF